MSDNPRLTDADIILSAYAEKVREAFRIFADNLSTGQPEKSCTERFQRAMQLSRKSRDLALEAIGAAAATPLAHSRGEAATGLGQSTIVEPQAEPAFEPLTADEQTMIQHVVEGTRGVAGATTTGGGGWRGRR